MDNTALTVATPILVSLITSGLTYMGLRHQYKSDLKKQEKIYKLEIDKLLLQHQNEIDKINSQLDAQVKLYEKNAQTDFTKDFMSDAIKNPKQAAEALTGLHELMKVIDKINPNSSK
ncbi:hypothetical protein F4V43_02240 [Paenibacillus spiritus]|uniref:Uncharacterized protein n=1 Tax=Paenibacillus spiritus TaxID=2496557 RepID=A0A5J5GGQ1_9BACL|nr:hypothetical protein [Paenibacillus spiritus]KAA9007325.1 hypothetical protein F4V43_02240 [Paenibacillus spiritus]